LYITLTTTHIMCWIWIVTCIEHEHTLMKRTELCPEGEKGTICLDPYKTDSASYSTAIYSKENNFIIKSSNQLGFRGEAVMPVKRRSVFCGMFQSTINITDGDKSMTRKRVKNPSILPSDSVSQVSTMTPKMIAYDNASTVSSNTTFDWINQLAAMTMNTTKNDISKSTMSSTSAATRRSGTTRTESTISIPRTTTNKGRTNTSALIMTKTDKKAKHMYAGTS